jgi:iron complex outermembrane receptor protein
MKHKQFRLSVITASLLAVSIQQGYSAENGTQAVETQLDEVVITAPRSDEPLVVKTNPKAPRQPIPAHDGADYLKSIPGFSVIRKAGTDGDPVFRGMAGSRLNILVDGQSVLGGCNFRMDAPTAYIFPEVFDSMTVIKGPQTVLYGPGNSAGTALFERKPVRFAESGRAVQGSLMAGSFGRHDEVLDAKFGNSKMYGQISGSNSEARDYRDGNDVAVHSAYRRYNVNGAVGWIPDADAFVELSAGTSDGHAAYADRGMDGTKFLRDTVALKAERKNLSPLFEKVDAQIGQSKVDHVMDDQTLRTPGMMGYANLFRDTTNARVSAALHVSDATQASIGLDAQNNAHRSRSAPAGSVANYTATADDAKFKQHGLFGEVHHTLTDKQKLLGGYRADFWNVQDQRGAMIMNMNMGPMMIANPSSGKSRDATLHSGFVRYEQQLDSRPATVYAGLGHAERFPDYWELIAKQSATTGSAFDTRPEKNTQLDVGALYKIDRTNVSVSAFYNKITDYILVDYSMKAGTGAVGNVNATTYGGELGWGQALNETWKLNTSLSYVHGNNDTSGTALAQLPPLEGKVGLSYDDKIWSFGALARLVAKQDRYDLNKGNIVGKDLGATSGFSVFSLNLGYRPSKQALLAAGIDNLLNKNYAESISRANGNGMGGAIPGYVQTTRVNEPGRTLWVKASLNLD